MSQVGFPGWNAINRRTTRASVNPMDRATIVSIFPLEINETKCTLQPSVFSVPAGTYEKPSILVVGPSSWWREIDPEQPLLEIPVASILIADSVVRDYCVGLLGCDMGDSMPGLFYVPGEITFVEIKTKHKNLLEIANRKQNKWFEYLVKQADIDWARTQGNPLAINQLSKMAASSLGIEDRDWLKGYRQVNMVRCAGCGAMKNPTFPICPTCKLIDHNHPEAKNFKFAV
jgi:hypothetical protein